MDGLDRSDLDRLEALAAAASPGPWFHVNLNDDVCMSAVGVALDDLSDEDTLLTKLWPSDRIVAATLIQHPDYVRTSDRRWDDNARFIAAARTHFDALIELARLGLASGKSPGAR